MTASALFIGHGSPMNTLELNRYTRSWRALGEALPRPRAILVVSAHWFFGATAVTAMARPRTIHDFYGFPQALFDFDYPAPGAPDVAREVVEAVKPDWVGLDHDQWGLDHGTWSVLAHLYPLADIPVVQLSINALKPFDYHLELARKLAALREKGVMIVGSGNVVHNLKVLRWDEPETGFDWAHRFDDAVVEQMLQDPAGILKVTGHPDFDAAVPTPDHFIPLLYFAGLASVAKTRSLPLVRGYAFGSISMTCYSVGCEVNVDVDVDGAAAASTPSEAPAEQSNI